MTDDIAIDDPIEAVALLEEPTRRRLYELVAGERDAVGRDDAAGALGISRELAAFHLDRLAGAGLLDVEFKRRSGRTGPGAGRPAKLYRRAAHDVAVSLPARRYDAAAEVLATALDRLRGRDAGKAAADAVAAVARERGLVVGERTRHKIGSRPSRRRLVNGLVDALRRIGYEPEVEPSGTVCLRNCPFDALVAEHRDLTCGMNLAWAEGVVDGLGEAGLRPVLEPKEGLCCVEFRASPSRPPREAGASG